MQESYLSFRIPSFNQEGNSNAGTTDESLAIYQELNQIAEEIETCRLRNC